MLEDGEEAEYVADAMALLAIVLKTPGLSEAFVANVVGELPNTTEETALFEFDTAEDGVLLLPPELDPPIPFTAAHVPVKPVPVPEPVTSGPGFG